MKVGTKSILFGVHQFLWHPYTIGRAWKKLYHRAPHWWEWVAIVCHDVGYWGLPNMDGEEGQRHPVRGAELARSLTHWIAATAWTVRHPFSMAFDSSFQFMSWMAISDTSRAAYELSIGHSRFYAKQSGVGISELFKADKACIFHDPQWFYLLRAHLSGEIWEFLKNSKLPEGTTSHQWFRWYQKLVAELL